MPWKNGQGESLQIEIFPPLADFSRSEFMWRLSSAKITGRNSFSLFPDHDRLLSVLSGGALELNSKTLIKAFSVFSFSGSDEITCELRGGDIVDLGLIYNRKCFDASMRFELIDQKPQSLKLSDGINFVICASSEMILNESKLEFLDTCKFEGEQEIRVWAPNSKARIGIVRILSRKEA